MKHAHLGKDLEEVVYGNVVKRVCMFGVVEDCISIKDPEDGDLVFFRLSDIDTLIATLSKMKESV